MIKQFGRLVLLLFLFTIISVFCGKNPVDSSDGDGGSGACSHHGGVNCTAGPDQDGSVICNDGWKDSRVQYSEVCKKKKGGCS